MFYLTVGLVSALLASTAGRPAQTDSSTPRNTRRQQQQRSTRQALGFIAAMITLTLVAGLREGPGTDYFARYLPMYGRIQGGLEVETEPTFLFLLEALAARNAQPQWLFFIMSLGTVTLVFRFIWRNSPMPGLSVFIFVFGGFYFEAFNLVRQALAIAILLNTIEFIARRRPVAFAVLTLLAATIHASAVIWLFVWPLARLSGARWTRFALVGALVIPALAAPSIAAQLVQRFAPDYAWYFQTDYGQTTSFEIIGLSIAIATFVGLIYVVPPQLRRNGITSIVANLQIAQIAVLIATLTIAYAFSRTAYYFTPLQMIALPLILTHIENRAARRGIYLLTVLIYLASFYLKFGLWGAHEVFPYKSVLL